MKTTAVVNGVARTAGAELYYEVRGAGPPVLMIQGSGADAGCYEPLAEILAGNFTVVTYDRRGTSRSPRPAGWTSTSIEEQADDASALLAALGLAPATIFASSTGALIGLELAIRHPTDVQGASLHEPTNFGVLPPEYVQEQFGSLTPLLEQAFSTGGPRAALQALYGFLAGGVGFEDLAPAEVRERWLANAEMVFAMEFPHLLMAYRPSEASIAAIRVPLHVLRAEVTSPLNVAAAEWLAARAGTSLLECPGPHLAYLTDPRAVAAAVGPFLARAAS